MSGLLAVVRAYYRAVTAFNRGLAQVVAVVMFVVVPIILFEVVSRYFFAAPTSWAMESATLIFGPYFLLAGPWLLHEGGHVNIDIVYNAMPRKVRLAFDCFGRIVIMGFCWVLADLSWPLAVNAWELGETSFSSWNPQIWWTKFFLPAALALLLLQALAEFLRAAARLVAGIDPVTGADDHAAAAAGDAA
ncbi:TRAP transporter small permease subunit (plasmid) [Tistrella bauzanensis]|uniref:TRAP transporter small permease protein n=1 Tax=Tistrella arctica TaxID=3133430 RepID=A0ABU9YLK4_9PROT